ncbi:pyridoxal 5'-phosphate synthase-like subunit PDX1.2 [Senna tora]|uniref:Pyridoxal 5'-phosphate synthase-like subunit PDX1.2 n=1 Tax=Senna tora TaxID=362788 RepID=A0A834W8K1_9FABA|nr:pyridoxal 5'-phosphate synthase-like subunit PDX1.2 [Senna tora]
MDDNAPTEAEYFGPTYLNPIDTSYSQKLFQLEKLRGGVILEVFNAHQAKIAQLAGVVAVAVFDRANTPRIDPAFVREIKTSVSIPVVARFRVGNDVEAQIIGISGADIMDENEMLGVIDDQNFIFKHQYNTYAEASPPFICGCRTLGEVFSRIVEGAAMIRIQGDSGGGRLAETVKNVRSIMADLRILLSLGDEEVSAFATKIGAPMDLLHLARKWRLRFPVMLWAAGGIVTPADAAMMMQLGCDGVFVGSEIFSSQNPIKRLKVTTFLMDNQVAPTPSANSYPNTPYYEKVKRTEKLRSGVILEVRNTLQAKMAQEAGVAALILSEPTNRTASRMMDPALIKDIKRAVSIPIVARARVGHFVEAQILDELGVDFIEESELLDVADEQNFINKLKFNASTSSPPFICGAQTLGEAFRRIAEGAAMIRIQGDLIESGSISKTVKHVKNLKADLRILYSLLDEEVSAFTKKIGAHIDLVWQAKSWKRLPVMLFASGGIATPLDAGLFMQMECDGVYVGSEIFKSSDPVARIKAIVEVVKSNGDIRVLNQHTVLASVTNKTDEAEPSESAA